jgi:hypothetical protein
MGGKKKSPPKPKGFKGSDVYRGDQLVSKTYQTKGGTTVNKYFETPQEKQQRMFAESRLGQLGPMLGQNPAEGSPYGIQRQNYVDRNKSLFDREYNKTLDTLRENVTSRFGTTQNSFYTDALGDMEQDVKMPAYLEMQRGADDYIRQNQVQEINALMALLGRSDQVYGGGINQGNQAAQMGNNFNMSRYQQQLAGYAATPQQTPWWKTALVGPLAP